ncbi:MAG: preprotein translocase subunit SecY [Candidatus Woesearchaeota archaeon]|nr:preprotein translocase subunit SecY [Candidatus Woesearchaeota archaeon]
MSFIKTLAAYLPEVGGPSQRKLGFKEKMKWTLLTLVLFFVLGMVSLFGLGANALEQFEFLSLILGAEFGSIISLGIGPLVTASIVIQLLNGSGLIKFDTSTPEGKKNFQAVQKCTAIFFVIFEACIYVFMGGLAPPAQHAGTALYFWLELLIVFQLFIGGMLIMFMDEVVSKWGFGSGISLFIAAGVAKQLFIRLFSPFTTSGSMGWPFGTEAPIGKLLELFHSLLTANPVGAALALATIATTAVIFCMAVYGQSMKVEIPLSFGRVRGHAIRWPLNFMYTSNIPVILIAALLANIQLWARLLQNWGHPFLGTFVGNSPATGLVMWLSPPNILDAVIKGTVTGGLIAVAVFYILILMIGATIFSYFWVQTSGMDANSQAKQILKSGLSIPGFRQDPRIMERILQRYIGPLTIMGGLSIGFLAGVADVMGALVNGTSLLLSIMIVYRLYEDIAKQHMYDMHPMMKKMMDI